MAHREVTYKRSELYEQVWSEAMQNVAKRYGVTGTALAKMCRKLHVPYPGRGYWARITAGQKVKRPALRKLPDGVPSEITTERYIREEKPVVVSAENAQKIEAERARAAAIEVAAVLDVPHRLVAITAKALRKAKPVDGLVTCRGHRALDVAVAPASVDRTLRILDALLKALDVRGLKVEVTEPARFDDKGNRTNGAEPANATRIRVDGEWIYVGIVERRTQYRPPVPAPPPGLSAEVGRALARLRRPGVVLNPSGQLVLTLKLSDDRAQYATWKDTDTKQLETRLNDVVARLFVAADAVKAERIAAEQRRIREEEAQRQAHERSMRRWEDERNAKMFRERIENRRFAIGLRQHVAEMRAALAEGGCSPSDEFGRQLAWAEEYAERIDPLVQLRNDVEATRREREEGS
jgi:hypothetical protein